MKKEKQVKEEISPRNQRLLEILEKYGEVDKENKVFTAKLHYDTVSELLVADISTKEKPSVNADAIERAERLIDKLPPLYKLSVKLEIDDYEGYDPNLVLEAFNDAMELEHYHTFRQGRKTWYLGALLALIGIGLLVVLNVLKVTGIIGEERLQDMITDYVLDTFACVFIWECISTLMLYPAEFYVRNNKVFNRFHSIYLLNSNHEVVAYENKEGMMKEWVEESGRKKRGKAFLLIMGSAMLALGTTAIVSVIVALGKTDFSQLSNDKLVLLISYSSLSFIVGVGEILAGIGAINDVREKGLFRRFVVVFASILLALYVCSVVITIYSGVRYGLNGVNATGIVSTCFGIVVTILLLVGCHYSKEKDVKNKDKNNKK